MLALIDVGNTSIKWAVLEAQSLTRVDRAVHRGRVDAALAALAEALPPRTHRAVVANVAGEQIGRRLRELLATRFGAETEFVTTSAERFGVRCAYEDPSRLGVDRWVAVLAAYRRAHGAACVIDAGTAVTFDAVDGAGRHLGGLIFPGRELLAAALHRQTSDIGATAPALEVPEGLALLGKSTDAGVGHGAMLALASALDRATRAVAGALPTAPAVYLTGGDAPALVGWLETSVELRADLVLEGLSLFAPPMKTADA
jgi:type III pantothenate kinase